MVALRIDRVSRTLRYQDMALLHLCASLVVVIMWGVWATVALAGQYVGAARACRWYAGTDLAPGTCSAFTLEWEPPLLVR